MSLYRVFGSLKRLLTCITRQPVSLRGLRRLEVNPKRHDVLTLPYIRKPLQNHIFQTERVPTWVGSDWLKHVFTFIWIVNIHSQHFVVVTKNQTNYTGDHQLTCYLLISWNIYNYEEVRAVIWADETHLWWKRQTTFTEFIISKARTKSYLCSPVCWAYSGMDIQIAAPEFVQCVVNRDEYTPICNVVTYIQAQ